ncbi:MULTISPECIES: peptidylprolyl isomerase [Ramlibacter]|uniref:Chaperone SurA n=1 Tax=Ramlibacter pinisoli TaxID=2682844 RepID=A0A6N8J190_9BURK|nr:MULTISPECIES: peptidylprolyl isomerase [Ramlibacter]MBA2962865.1 peptidylprolyl isomerase [Ramlibacter sp. CGMCC 1.13660]MVQ32808.1 molecular chaperone SurA [Ramlibacter pinisoli]
MTPRAFALLLAGAAALALPAAAQLRASPQLGGGRPAAAETGPRAADFIVAVVNSEPITNNEVRTRLLRFEQQLTQQGTPLPSRGELNRMVLERLISERAQLQLARDNGIRVDEGTIDQAEQSFARQNQVDVAELRRRLALDGISQSSFREDLRNQLLLSRLRDREVEQRVRVTDNDVEQFLREQQGSSGDLSQTELNLAQVLVAVPENATEAQVQALRTKADDVLRRARAGEDFAVLARDFSEAAGAAASGGQLGLRSAERYPQLFLDAVQGLSVGGVSEVIRSGAGFHVLKVVERRQAGLPGATVTQTHSRHILLRTGAQLTEAAARARLADYKRRIESRTATFEQLAREFSQDASSSRGGDLGWTNPGQFVPEFEEVLGTLQPGQIAEPMTSRFGAHLIQLLERRQATLSAREQRELARNLVREKKLDEAFLQWSQEVRGRAYVEYRDPPQ